MELIKIENITMTSREIAELTGKNHKDVMRDIRDESNKLGKEIAERIFALGSYEDKNNQNRKQYTLNKDGVMQIGARYDAKIRYQLIQKLKELENKIITPSYQITDPIERANTWIKEQKEKQVLLEQREEDKPKVEFYDTVTGSSDTLDFGAVAKVINKNGYGRNKLFKFLRRKKILMQNNQPYQKYIDNGCFRTIETKFTKSNGEISINIKTLVYQKGVDLISKLLDKNL